MRKFLAMMLALLLIVALSASLVACNRKDDSAADTEYTKDIKIATEVPVYTAQTKSAIATSIGGLNTSWEMGYDADELAEMNSNITDSLKNGKVSDSAVNKLCQAIDQYSPKIKVVIDKIEDSQTGKVSAADIGVFKDAYSALVSAIGEDALGQLGHSVLLDFLHSEVEYYEDELSDLENLKMDGPNDVDYYNNPIYRYQYGSEEYMSRVFDNLQELEDAITVSRDLYASMNDIYNGLNSNISIEQFIVMSRVIFSVSTAVITDFDQSKGATSVNTVVNRDDNLTKNEIYSLLKDNLSIIKDLNIGAEGWNAMVTAAQVVAEKINQKIEDDGSAEQNGTIAYIDNYTVAADYVADNVNVGEMLSFMIDISYTLLNGVSETELGQLYDFVWCCNKSLYVSDYKYYYENTEITKEQYETYAANAYVAGAKVVCRLSAPDRTKLDGYLQAALAAYETSYVDAVNNAGGTLPAKNTNITAASFNDVWSSLTAIANSSVNYADVSDKGDVLGDKALGYLFKYAPYYVSLYMNML